MNTKFQIPDSRRDPRSKIQDPRLIVKRPTSNVERRTSYLEPQTSNVKRQTSNFKLVAAFFSFFCLLGCNDSDSIPPSSALRPQAPLRIISLAPSITEVLFTLNLDDRVVGVTRYCDYPPEALAKDKVGGYFDVNYEAVLALEPDVVIHLTEHEDAQRRLQDLGIETLAVNHSRVKGILQSITTIGDRCGAKEKGAGPFNP